MKTFSYINPRPFFYCFLALLFSISVTQYIFDLSIQHIVLFVSISVGLIAGLICFKKFFMLFLILATMLFGCCWYFVGINSYKIDNFDGTVSVTGRLSDNVEYEEEETTYLLKDVIVNGKSVKNVELTILGEGRNLSVGDVIEFEAELSEVALFSLNSFNLTYYRNKTGYVAEVDLNDVNVVDNEIKLVEKFRLRVKDLLVENMSPDDGATAYAVLFGYTNDISDDTYSAYQDAGILHLLAVSGLNVTFLISLIGFFLKILKVNRFTNFITCFIVLIVYAYLCSFAPSILRAGIMGIIFLACQLSGRCYDSLNTLGIAGVLVLITSPLFAFDIGFLMSYFCVMGIILLSPILSSFLRKIFPKFVADSLSVSISATIAILPFLAMMYSKLNLLTFFTNLLTVPLFSVAYPFLCVATIICLIFPFMGFLLTLCGYIFTLVSLIAQFFAQTPLSIQLAPFNVAISGFIFLMLFSISRFFMASTRGKVVAFTSLASIITIAGCVFAYIPMCSAGVLYVYTHDNSFVLLTNSKNETLILDATWNFSDVNNALIEINAHEVIANIQINNVLPASSQEFLHITNYSHVDITNREGTEALSYNSDYYLGDFRIRYITFENELIGLEVEFDNMIVLRPCSELSQEALDYLSLLPYDLILAYQPNDAFLDFNGKVLSTTGGEEDIYLTIKDNKFVYRRTF